MCIECNTPKDLRLKSETTGDSEGTSFTSKWRKSGIGRVGGGTSLSHIILKAYVLMSVMSQSMPVESKGVSLTGDIYIFPSTETFTRLHWQWEARPRCLVANETSRML